MLLASAIETPRLRIRSWNRSDRDFTLSLWGDPENGRYLSDPLRENMDARYLACVDGMEDDPEGYYCTAEDRLSGARIGTCCAFFTQDNCDIGYCIEKAHWKEGLGTELLDALLHWICAEGGRSVTAEVADDNRASIALLHKFGFAAVQQTRFGKRGSDVVYDAHIYRLDLPPLSPCSKRSLP